MSPKRVDQNQAEIVAALRAVGATVQDLHEVGKGCPDALIGFRGQTFLIEFKSPGGRLTSNQITWIQHWNGALVLIVDTVALALRAIGAEEASGGER